MRIATPAQSSCRCGISDIYHRHSLLAAVPESTMEQVPNRPPAIIFRAKLNPAVRCCMGVARSYCRFDAIFVSASKLSADRHY